MKPPPFDYLAVTSVEAAVGLLSSDRDARVLAGGQSLLPILNLRLGSPEVLVDIGRIAELGVIDVSPDRLRVGATVTQRQLALDPDTRARWPLLTEAAQHIGHPQIRNRGTVCGSLAHNDPQAELPAVAVALGAEVIVESIAGQRRVAAAEFFTGPFSTALAADELLVAVEFPPQPAGWAFQEFAARPGDFALAGVACVLSRDEAMARVVMFGVGSGPIRAVAVEEALLADSLSLEQAVEIAVDGLDPADDVHASAASRRTLMSKLLTEAAAEAQQRTTDPQP